MRPLELIQQAGALSGLLLRGDSHPEALERKLRERSHGSAQALQQVIPHAQGIGHRRQRGVDRGDAGEETGVHDVEIIEFVGFTVDIEHRRSGISAKAARASLVAHPGDGDVFPQIEIVGNQVLVTAEMLQHGM